MSRRITLVFLCSSLPDLAARGRSSHPRAVLVFIALSRVQLRQWHRPGSARTCRVPASASFAKARRPISRCGDSCKGERALSTSSAESFAKAALMRDFFQVSPEGLFKADAGLVSTNCDGAFNDRGFHWSPRTPPDRHHVDQTRQRGRRYMDDVAAGNIIHGE